MRPGLPPRYYGILFCLGIGTFFVHEFAHWLAGVLLGHDMVASPNHVRSLSPMSVLDQGLVLAAGPVVTIAQGILGFRLVGRGAAPLAGLALVYMAFFMRLLATVMTLFNPNDEAKIGQLLGIGKWTLPLLVTAGLLILFVAVSRRMKLGIRDHLFSFVVASVVVSLIEGLDRAFWRTS